MRSRGVAGAPARAALLLHLRLHQMPPPTDQLVAHRAVQVQRGAVVAVVVLLHHLEGPAAVEHVAPHELAVDEVGELADSGRWELIVVDCASTADAMRMLTLPATFGLYLERAWPRHRRLAGIDDARSAALVALLERIAAGTDRLGALLSDGSRVSAHLVLTAERVVAAEAVRTLGSLAFSNATAELLEFGGLGAGGGGGGLQFCF